MQRRVRRLAHCLGERRVRVNRVRHLLDVSSPSPSTASEISSVAFGPMMCTPSSSPCCASDTIFTKPSGSPMIRALPLAVNGNVPTLTV